MGITWLTCTYFVQSDRILFMDTNSHKPFVFIAFLIPLIMMLAVLGAIMAIMALFQGGIMSFIGFSYTTIPSFFLFFCASYIVGIPLELFAQSLPRALSIMGSVQLRGTGYYAIMIGIETLGYAFIMMCADTLMTSITATGMSILVASAAAAVIDAWIDYRLPDQFSTDDILKDLPL